MDTVVIRDACFWALLVTSRTIGYETARFLRSQPDRMKMSPEGAQRKRRKGVNRVAQSYSEVGSFSWEALLNLLRMNGFLVYSPWSPWMWLVRKQGKLRSWRWSHRRHCCHDRVGNSVPEYLVPEWGWCNPEDKPDAPGRDGILDQRAHVLKERLKIRVKN